MTEPGFGLKGTTLGEPNIKIQEVAVFLGTPCQTAITKRKKNHLYLSNHILFFIMYLSVYFYVTIFC